MAIPVIYQENVLNPKVVGVEGISHATSVGKQDTWQGNAQTTMETQEMTIFSVTDAMNMDITVGNAQTKKIHIVVVVAAADDGVTNVMILTI